MSFESEKLDLIKWLSEVDDQEVLSLIKWIQENQSQGKDWWHELSEAEKASIDQGLQDIANGDYYDHEIAMKKCERWL